MDERRLRLGSLFEWLAAALAVAALVWLVSVPLQRMIGPRVEAALVDVRVSLPSGVPAGATASPVLLLLDGRTLRVGDSHTRVVQMLPDRLATGPPLRSPAPFGERLTRTYETHSTTVVVVCERLSAGGPLQVAGIYLP